MLDFFFFLSSRIHAHSLHPAITQLDFFHLEISVFLRNCISLLIAKTGKNYFSLVCFHIQGIKTPETGECWEAEEKKDRENFKVIELYDCQWVSSVAKTEPALFIFNVKVGCK